MPPRRRFFVHAHLDHHPSLFPLPSPRRRPLHNALGFIPAHPQDLAGAFEITRLKHVDCQAFKQRREPRFRLRPRHAHLLYSVRRTLHSRHPSVKKHLELERIQMTPDALGSMVVNRQIRPAFRTSPAKSFLMYRPDINALAAAIQLNTIHFSGFLQPQHMAIKLGILHDSRTS
jgi:hypothetical protein